MHGGIYIWRDAESHNYERHWVVDPKLCRNGQHKQTIVPGEQRTHSWTK